MTDKELFDAVINNYEKKKDGRSAYIAGDCYHDGIGTPKDLKKAFEFYSRAADLGIAEGLYKAGLMMLNGIGTEKNVHDGEFKLRRAATANVAEAQFVYGEHLAGKKGLIFTPSQRHRKALEYVLSAAMNGHSLAQIRTGVYLLQIGTDAGGHDLNSQDIRSALTFFAAAYGHGPENAHYETAKYYLDNGIRSRMWTKKDIEKQLDYTRNNNPELLHEQISQVYGV